MPDLHVGSIVGIGSGGRSSSFGTVTSLVRIPKSCWPPRTLTTRRGWRANRTLPMFQEALLHFQRGEGHTGRTQGLAWEQRVEDVYQYIDIQERLIVRANR